MPTRRELLLGGIAAIAALAPVTALAVDVVLGTRIVNLGRDRDRIRVGMLRGLFTHLRLEVSGNGIFLLDLKVTFMNGETADLWVRRFIEEGGRTRDILLPGIVRAIRHIDLTYRRVPGGGRATVTAVGRRL